MNLSDHFLAPTSEAWDWAINNGWSGSDGSSCSFDHVMGVRIGLTSRAYEDVYLPANAHDWRYFLGRLLGLDESHRKRADQLYRDGCITLINNKLNGWRRVLGVSRCHVRYAGLRVGARFAWTQAQRMQNLSWRTVSAQG